MWSKHFLASAYLSTLVITYLRYPARTGVFVAQREPGRSIWVADNHINGNIILTRRPQDLRGCSIPYVC